MFAGVPLGESIREPLQKQGNRVFPAGTRCIPISFLFQALLVDYIAPLVHFIVFDAEQYLAHAARRWVLSIHKRTTSHQPLALPRGHRHRHTDRQTDRQTDRHTHPNFIFQCVLTLA
jgi:hypothetical protein